LTDKGCRLLLRPHFPAVADRLEPAAARHRPPELVATSLAGTDQRHLLLRNRH